MMQGKISKTIEATINRTVSMLTCGDISSSYTDRLVIELLSDDDSSACRVLKLLAGDNAISSIMRRIAHRLCDLPHCQSSSPRQHFDDMCNSLTSMLDFNYLTSAHLLYAASFDTTTATSAALHGYGIAPSDILLEIERMECNDDNKSNIS